MSFIAEAFVAAAFDVLLEKLSSTDLLQFARQQQVHDDLKKWRTLLVKIQAVLADAEEKQMTNSLVEIWLGELKNLAYDMEDVLDEFATEALRRKLLEEPQASTSKVRKLIPTCCTGLNPRSLRFNSAMASQIKEINNRLKDIVEQKDSFDLNKTSGASFNRAGYQRPPTTHVNEPHIYGREEDKEAILELLLKDGGAAADATFSVISIEGMGGIGKTTLAQLAYNDAKVKTHFDIKVWVCVSEDFDIVRITRTILQSIILETTDVDSLSKLHEELMKQLSEKKFFIVLDDVWNEKYEDWTILCRPFEAGSFGSKVVVTTRNNGVSSMVGTLPAYQLKELSNDECLPIFTYHSLGKMDFNEHQDLKEIGEKIVKRCKGLPLAAKTLGGLLRGKLNSKDWKEVLDSNMWNLSEDKSGIIPALRVSYFAYCSIFPKDYVFRKKELILLWTAEGFLQTKGTEKQIEDLAEEYFDDLRSRSFFQEFGYFSRRIKDKFVMHDLINDLAQWATKDFCLRIENLQEGKKQWKISKNLRHLSYLNDDSNKNCIKNFGAFNEMKNVRTFLTLSPNYWSHGTSDFYCMVLQLRRLRVLSLNGYHLSELPNSIGDLKILHHLDLSHNEIEFLPDSINTLYNLETLILKHCIRLKRLCSDMGNLIKLRHLYFSYPIPLPSSVGQLTSLRTLPCLLVDKDMGSGIRGLKDLTNLQERLNISGLENVNDLWDVEKADLHGKEGLKDLQLEWTCNSSGGSNEKEIAAQVLEKLRPCRKLESLLIQGYGGTRYPWWLGDTSFLGLVSLTFQDCKNCASFPSIGQLPSLKELCIRNVDGIGILGPEFNGHDYSTTPFHSLETFSIENLQELRELIPYESGRNVDAFPRLQQLSIIECPKLLGKLPEHLPSLERLIIRKCWQWEVSVPILPKHCTIDISECKEVVLTSIKDHSSMSSMVHFLSCFSSGMFIAEGFMEKSLETEKLHIIRYIKSKPSLEIVSKPQTPMYHCFCNLISKVEKLGQQGLPYRVQFLELRDCKGLVKLEEALQRLSFLRGLTIAESPKIISFPEASLPAQLSFISIKKCDALQSLPTAWMHCSNTSLRKLYISHCHSLTCITRVHLPANLKLLQIKHCSNLLTVWDEEDVSGSSRNTPCIESLKLKSCPSLTAVWSKSNELPDTLQMLKVKRCSKLESIAKSFHDNTKLEYLRIEDCERLEALPSGLNNLISLQRLVLEKCPRTVSFPEGGFPTSLKSLWIEDMNICTSLFEWGLHRLTSLEALYIRGRCPDVMSFPQEEMGMILPISLKELAIRDFPNLERLSSAAQNLPCLKLLYLHTCPKLKHLPEDGLPQSVKELCINKCPLLEERCKKDTGLYWSMIAHLSCEIPCFDFDDEEWDSV